MTSTKLLSLNKIRNSGKAFSLRQRIKMFIEIEPGATRRQISKSLRLELSTVTARVNELLADRQIREAGTTTCSFTGRTVKQLWPKTKAKRRISKKIAA